MSDIAAEGLAAAVTFRVWRLAKQPYCRWPADPRRSGIGRGAVDQRRDQLPSVRVPSSSPAHRPTWGCLAGAISGRIVSVSVLAQTRRRLMDVARGSGSTARPARPDG